MKHSTTCECPSAPLKRPRYFPRQLITPAEMNLEQDYFRERLRLHNRMLHGWGTVCGAKVCAMIDENGDKRPWCVIVKPGYLLGPCGDEIYIDCEVKVDLRKPCVDGTTGDRCLEDREASFRDPWCSEVYVPREAGPLFVAVRYREILARQVPVQPVGCGCDETACEYSRWCDGYEICTLPECPESYKNPPENLDHVAEGPIPPCPECPDSPWVVLAKVDVDADGIVREIDNCSCRRMVVSLGHAWWKCETTGQGEEEQPATSIEAVDVVDGRVAVGETFVLEVRGGPFPAGARLDLGSFLSVTAGDVDPKVIKAKVDVDSRAAPGWRTLTVVDANGRVIARVENALEVEARSAGGGGGKKPTTKKTKKTTRKAKKKVTPSKKTPATRGG